MTPPPGVVSTPFGAGDPDGVQQQLVPFVRDVHEVPDPGRCNVNPWSFRSRARAGDGPLLRQQQTHQIVQAQLRRGRCGTALAGKRGIWSAWQRLAKPSPEHHERNDP